MLPLLPLLPLLLLPLLPLLLLLLLAPQLLRKLIEPLVLARVVTVRFAITILRIVELSSTYKLLPEVMML